MKMSGKQAATLSANDQSSRSYYSSFSNDAQTAYTHKVGPYVPGIPLRPVGRCERSQDHGQGQRHLTPGARPPSTSGCRL